MKRYIKITNGGGVTELPGYPDYETIEAAFFGSITLLQIDGDAFRQYNGNWCLIERRPTVNGIYMVQTSSNQGFHYSRVAVWHDDHWRTPDIGRVDGDNRIHGVLCWQGPLECQSENTR